MTSFSYFFLLLFACASALAAIDLVRDDERPSRSAADAAFATFELVTFELLDFGATVLPSSLAPRADSTLAQLPAAVDVVTSWPVPR